MQSLMILNGVLCVILPVIGSFDDDFFKSLEKLDIDSKLREIDKAINSIDDDDSHRDFVPGSKKHDTKANKEETTLGDAVEMFADLFGNECIYKCKNGNQPKPKVGYKVSSNGCGSYGIKVDVDEIPGMEDCCHAHDHCYDTCNAQRTTCDKNFKQCLQNTCVKLKSSKAKKKVSDKDCRTAADLLYSATAALGCDPFLKSQENACSCGKLKEDIKSDESAKKASTTDKVNKDGKSKFTKGKKDEL